MTDGTPTSREKQRVDRLWSGTPYHEYGRLVAPAAADIVEFVGVSKGDEVLDVACGTGNTAMVAARRGADATGIDLSERMIEWARENAALIEPDIDTDIEFRRGDARSLPVEDDAYDVVLSTFGHQLASDPIVATEELVRATRPGGRVGFAAYARDGGAAVTFELLSEYHPELTYQEAIRPYKLGDEEFVREQFSGLFDSLSFERSELRIQAPSPRHFWEYFLDIIGSVRVPFEEIEDEKKQEEVFETLVQGTAEDWERNATTMEYVLVKGEV